MKTLNIPYIFKTEAEILIKAREKSIQIHGTANIKAAGNEVEVEVRNFLERMLPKNLYVTQGHLIDKNGIVSTQLDLIISEKSNLPSLFTTHDGTEYIPIDSVYAIGEIKSTYYKNKNYEQRFSEVISQIKTQMFHQEYPNTAYEGQLNDNTIIQHSILGSTNRVLNKIYYFMICVDGGDFDVNKIKSHYLETNNNYLPNLTVILNKGAISFAKMLDNALLTARYPDEEDVHSYSWLFSPLHRENGSGSPEGNHLGLLYTNLISHISNSFLEAPDISQYMSSMLVGRKSTSEWFSK